MIILILVFLFPFLYGLLISFKPLSYIRMPVLDFSFKKVFSLEGFTLDKYAKVLLSSDFPRYVLNTSIIFVLTSVIVIPLSFFCGYTLARYRTIFHSYFRMLLYAVMMIPVLPALFTLYKWISMLGLYDTHLGLALLYSVGSVPFSAFLLENTIKAIPPEVEQQARVDGCGTIGTMLRIVLPLSAPGIGAVAITLLVSVWNEVFTAIIFTANRAKTVQVGLADFVTRGYTDYSAQAAALVVASLPMIVLIILGYRQLIRAMTGGMKGH